MEILEVNFEIFCHYHNASLKAISPTVRNNEADARCEPRNLKACKHPPVTH